MSYSVYVQKFEQGEQSSASFGEVVAILKKYGSVDRARNRLEFTPNGDDICEVGFIGGDEEGIVSVAFERPVSGGRLSDLVFELLAVDGMCYFELDCSYVLARTDVTKDLPEGLIEQCETSRVTVIKTKSEIPL